MSAAAQGADHGGPQAGNVVDQMTWGIDEAATVADFITQRCACHRPDLHVSRIVHSTAACAHSQQGGHPRVITCWQSWLFGRADMLCRRQELFPVGRLLQTLAR